MSSSAAIIVRPGAIGGRVNAHLKAYGRKIGPDPSSIMPAMMGGILSNNASGMCCGVKLNAYITPCSRFALFFLISWFGALPSPTLLNALKWIDKGSLAV